MKFKPVVLVLFLILAAPVFAQELKARVVEPIRVAVTTQGEAPHNEELDKLLRDELQKRRDFISVSSRADLRVEAAAAELTADTGCRGYVGALVIEDGHGRQLSVFIADGLPSLARQFAERIDELRKNKVNATTHSQPDK